MNRIWKSKPSDKMLAEIAVKNFLLQLSKRTQEEEIHKELQRKFNAYTNPEELGRHYWFGY